MRHLIVAVSLLLGSVSQANAQVGVHVGVGVALPGVQIGINVPAYPRLVAVPGYPVYYAPAAATNYFFYDGAYWVYQGDTWYVSSWYAGPWYAVEPYDVPEFVLRVPVRYYRAPPPYFRGWHADRSPRWGEHWGRDWEARRAGWDRWDRRQAPRPAPLPAYQRSYVGPRYPREVEQQRAIHGERYRYAPRENVTRQHYGDAGGWRGEHERRDAPRPAPAPAPAPRGGGYGHDQGQGQWQDHGRGQGQQGQDHGRGQGQQGQDQGRGQGHQGQNQNQNQGQGDDHGRGHGRGDERGNGRW